MELFGGVDPGLKGATAVLSVDGSGVVDLQVEDMPTDTITVSGKDRARLNMHALNLTIGAARWAGCHHWCVEDLSGRPASFKNHKGQTIAQKGQFEQGWNACAPVALLVANTCVYQMVRPSEWKKAMKVPAAKDANRREAARLLPKFAHYFQRVKDDGRAEAALLALYMWELSK